MLGVVVHGRSLGLGEGVGEFSQKRECLVAETSVCLEDDGDDVVRRIIAFFLKFHSFGGVARGDRRYMVASQG